MKGKLYLYFAVALPIFKRSYSWTLDQSGMSHDVAERHDVERLEQATDNSNIQVLKSGKFVLIAHRGIKGYPFYMLMHCLQFQAYNQNANTVQ